MSAPQHKTIIFQPLFYIPAFPPTFRRPYKTLYCNIYIDIPNTKQWLSTLTGYPGKISPRRLQKKKKIPKLSVKKARKC